MLFASLMTSPAPTTTDGSNLSPFQFPNSHSFPPIYSLQPNPTTRLEQNRKWSRTIQLYCRHHRLFRLSLPSCLDLPLFKNTQIQKRLAEKDARAILDWVASSEGGKRGEWAGHDNFWVYWKRPEEWGDLVWRWVDEVGQKGSVLTFYEILHGAATTDHGGSACCVGTKAAKWWVEFHNVDAEIFAKAMASLVKRGKAQVFGDEDSRGVKFF